MHEIKYSLNSAEIHDLCLIGLLKKYLMYIIFKGCDTTSAFYDKGKVIAFNVATSKLEYSSTFAQIGREVELSNELRDGLACFVCHLYGFEESSDINAVRFQLFKGRKYEEELLPPNQDSLNQHTRRANYQCYIWRHACSSNVACTIFL